MNGKRARELRSLANTRPAIPGTIPNAVVSAGDSAVIIKGATPRRIYKTLKKRYAPGPGRMRQTGGKARGIVKRRGQGNKP